MNGRLQIWRTALRQWRGARRLSRARLEEARRRRHLAVLYPA